MVKHKKPIRVRVVIAKVGCDIHGRGPLTLMAAFRDAGIEVIYTGLYQTPEGVVKTAIQEGADVLALSDMTGSMRHIATAVLKALKKEDISNIHVVAGGLIPKKDIPILEKMGVTGNFGPGTPIQEIINHIVTVASQKNDLSSV